MQGQSSDSRKRLWTASILSLAAVLGAATVTMTFGGEPVAYESPKYQVIDSVGEVEIRDYEPYLVAETAVDGDLETAGNRNIRARSYHSPMIRESRSGRYRGEALRRCAIRAPGRSETMRNISGNSSIP